MPRKPKATETAAYVAYLVHGDDADVVRGELEKRMPDWAQLKAREQDEIVALTLALNQKPATPAYGLDDGSLSPSGNVTLHTLRMAEALATQSGDLVNRRVDDLARQFGSDQSPQRLGADVAFVRGAAPQDTVQSTLAVQMAATHNAAMRALRLSVGADFADQATSMGNLAAKLLNVFTRQAEVLSKLQRGGEQIIKHLYLDNRGGQAVIADTVTAGGVGGKDGNPAHALGPALLGTDPWGNGVPIASGEGQAALSAPRRSERVGRATG